MIDTQAIESAGKHYLISQLLAAGVEVAIPARDRGIDLIAYLDDPPIFLACPIQLKANGEARFGIDRKYEAIPNLLMVYAWMVTTNAPELYALNYQEVVTLLEGRGHTNTRSWNELGGYSLRVNDTWREMLQPYRMHRDDWRAKIQTFCSTSRTANLEQSIAEVNRVDDK